MRKLAGRRLIAVIALAAGVVVVGAGAAGLALTRTPAAARLDPAPALPAPSGPIVAVGQAEPVTALPVSLVIPSIGVQTPLVDLGVTADGALQVPASTSVAGWYTGSPRPGDTGSAIIAGHIDSVSGPGIFYHLSQLQPGAKVYIRNANGTLAVFRVTQVQAYAKDDFPTGAVYGPTPDPELRLITCGGAFDAARKSYESNTVVYAVQTT